MSVKIFIRDMDEEELSYNLQLLNKYNPEDILLIDSYDPVIVILSYGPIYCAIISMYIAIIKAFINVFIKQD